jgi:enoyl-CoA hydratase/carnithine racemase
MTTTFPWTVAEGVATLTLTPASAQKPPTFDHESLDAFTAALAEIGRQAEKGAVRMLFVRSASERCFCAGANINALQQLNRDTIGAWVEHGHRVFNQLADLPVPTVAVVRGFALGGGLELALACDLIFAEAGAQLAQTEATLGFVAGWGGSARLPRRVGAARAREMFYSARRVPAAEAVALGLVDFVGESAALERRCADFAAAVAAGSPVAHTAHKQLVQAASGADRAMVLAAETAASIRCVESSATQTLVQNFLKSRGR